MKNISNIESNILDFEVYREEAEYPNFILVPVTTDEDEEYFSDIRIAGAADEEENTSFYVLAVSPEELCSIYQDEYPATIIIPIAITKDMVNSFVKEMKNKHPDVGKLDLYNAIGLICHSKMALVVDGNVTSNPNLVYNKTFCIPFVLRGTGELYSCSRYVATNVLSDIANEAMTQIKESFAEITSLDESIESALIDLSSVPPTPNEILLSDDFKEMCMFVDALDTTNDKMLAMPFLHKKLMKGYRFEDNTCIHMSVPIILGMDLSLGFTSRMYNVALSLCDYIRSLDVSADVEKELKSVINEQVKVYDNAIPINDIKSSADAFNSFMGIDKNGKCKNMNEIFGERNKK